MNHICMRTRTHIHVWEISKIKPALPHSSMFVVFRHGERAQEQLILPDKNHLRGLYHIEVVTRVSDPL